MDPRNLRRALPAALLATALLFACSNDFEKQSQLEKLRVLGIQAEPAELVLQPDGGLPKATLTALAVEPSGAVITSRFSVCLQQGTLPQPDIGCPGDAGIDLPDAGALSATLDLADPRLQAAALQLLSADAGSSGDGGAQALLDQGLPLLYGFELRAPAYGNPDGGPPPAPGFDVQRLLGLGTLNLRSAAQGSEPNHNPQLAEIDADGVALAADGSTALKAGVRVTLLPIPAAGSKEPTSATVTGVESLNFSFFATDGEVGSLRSVDTTSTGQPGISSVDYTPPSAPPAKPVRLWVVVRDGRGGVGWLERSFTVVK
jgi:hypothetical protein